jgi:hypothetical protein
MANDVFVEVGPMSASKDAKKVPKEFAAAAPKLMRAAAVREVKKAKGFTPDKKGSPKEGFYIDATLTGVTIDAGAKTVKCELSGVVATYPKKKMLTSSVSGSATLKGGTDTRDVEDCIAAVAEAITKDKIIPFLKKQ